MSLNFKRELNPSRFANKERYVFGRAKADGYGFALLDVRDLSEFLKDRKCRAKKLLSYWDAHKQLFYDAVKGAKALPFYPLTVRSYEIFVCMDEEFAPPSGYEVVFMRDRLYFAPQSGSAILASFDALQYSAGKLKNGELAMSVKAALRARYENLIPRSS